MLIDFAHAYFDPGAIFYAGVEDALSFELGVRRQHMRPASR